MQGQHEIKYFEKKRENEKMLKEILKFCVVFVFIIGKKLEFHIWSYFWDRGNKLLEKY